MSRVFVSDFQLGDSFPRVSGDEPSKLSGGGAYSSFSPRERG